MTKARDLANSADVFDTVSTTELGYLDGVTSAVQTQIDGKQAVVANVSDTEIGYLDGVTSAVQTQIDGKQAVVSGVSDTEIGYLDGVTSAIQTQLNTKAVYPSQTGNSGKYLTTDGTNPSWADVSAGGMTLLASGTLSGSSVVVSGLSTAYTDLRIIIRNYRPATDANRLYFRINNDATASRHIALNGFSQSFGGSFAETSVQISENVDNGTANYGLISYTIPDYANTVSAKFFYGNSMSNNSTTSTNVNIEARWGAYNQTSAVTGITFLNLTGNFTSGNYYIYGVK